MRIILLLSQLTGVLSNAEFKSSTATRSEISPSESRWFAQRRGKHHELVQGILRELDMLSVGSAMEIPLWDVGGIGVANLRSAVHRAANAHRLEIETLADEENSYVWKKSKSEAK